MRKIFFTMFTFIFGLLWAGVRVEKVLETTSVKEYNQWVAQNKARYPELRPILIKYSMEQQGSTRKYTIEYYSKDGEKLKVETIIDTFLYVWVPPTNDRVIITKTPGYKSSGKNKVIVK